MAGRSGKSRIGNRRAQCGTCNKFAQNVMRLTRKRLADLHSEEYVRIRGEIEADLYPQVVEEWIEEHPRSEPQS